jgi:hypothetical protein
VSEGMSGALLEAMACGCPVLARDVPGNRALVAAPNSGSSVVGRRRGPGWEEVESGLLFSTPAGFAGAAAATLRGEAQEAAARAQVGSPPPSFALSHSSRVSFYESQGLSCEWVSPFVSTGPRRGLQHIRSRRLEPHRARPRRIQALAARPLAGRCFARKQSPPRDFRLRAPAAAVRRGSGGKRRGTLQARSVECTRAAALFPAATWAGGLAWH